MLHRCLMSSPTPAFSGAAGRLHKSGRAMVCHHASRSRPGQGPRQRRPLQSNVGRCGDERREEILALRDTINRSEYIRVYSNLFTWLINVIFPLLTRCVDARSLASCQGLSPLLNDPLTNWDRIYSENIFHTELFPIEVIL